MATLFPDCVKGEAHPEQHIPDKKYSNHIHLANFIPVEKIKWSIDSFRLHKAAGPNGIKPVVLQHCGPVMLTRLTNFVQMLIPFRVCPHTMV